MKEFRLTEHEVMSLSSRMPTPFMVASTDKIEENYRFMRHHLPHAGIYYAIKANPTPAILKRLIGLGAHFDVASAGEMALLHGMGVDGSRMIYANTVKNISGLKMAAKIGLNRFTFDEETEIDKMAAYVPGADVLLRISVHNSKAKVDLNTKFGAPPSMACELLMKARDKGLNPIGICFHVGSQSFSTAAYEEALLLCHGIFDEAKRMGLNLTDLDIGGGFPVPSLDCPHVDPAPMMDAIDRQIADADTADGEAILNHILGDDAASVTSGLAAQTGLTNEQVTGTLNNVAPAILSELSAATTQVQKKGGVDLSDGLDFSDLMGMFSGIQSAQSQSNQGGGLLSGLVGALLGGKQEEKPQVQQSSGASAMDLLSGLMGSGAGSTGGLANLLGGDADEASFNGASLLSSLLGK